jgi:hypothetical protein
MELHGDLKITGGTVAFQTTSTPSGYTVGNETIIGVTNTDSPYTVTIAASLITNNDGHIFIVKDETGGASANTITVVGESEITIDSNVAGTTITNAFGSVRLYSRNGKLWTW